MSNTCRLGIINQALYAVRGSAMTASVAAYRPLHSVASFGSFVGRCSWLADRVTWWYCIRLKDGIKLLMRCTHLRARPSPFRARKSGKTPSRQNTNRIAARVRIKFLEHLQDHPDDTTFLTLDLAPLDGRGPIGRLLAGCSIFCCALRQN